MHLLSWQNSSFYNQEFPGRWGFKPRYSALSLAFHSLKISAWEGGPYSDAKAWRWRTNKILWVMKISASKPRLQPKGPGIIPKDRECTQDTHGWLRSARLIFCSGNTELLCRCWMRERSLQAYGAPHVQSFPQITVDIAQWWSARLKSSLISDSVWSRNGFDESLFVLQDTKMYGSEILPCQHFSVVMVNMG